MAVSARLAELKARLSAKWAAREVSGAGDGQLTDTVAADVNEEAARTMASTDRLPDSKRRRVDRVASHGLDPSYHRGAPHMLGYQTPARPAAELALREGPRQPETSGGEAGLRVAASSPGAGLTAAEHGTHTTRSQLLNRLRASSSTTPCVTPHCDVAPSKRRKTYGGVLSDSHVRKCHAPAEFESSHTPTGAGETLTEGDREPTTRAQLLARLRGGAGTKIPAEELYGGHSRDCARIGVTHGKRDRTEAHTYDLVANGAIEMAMTRPPAAHPASSTRPSAVEGATGDRSDMLQRVDRRGVYMQRELRARLRPADADPTLIDLPSLEAAENAAMPTRLGWRAAACMPVIRSSLQLGAKPVVPSAA